MFKKGNKESIEGGKASAKSRFKGKTKKQRSEIMKKLRARQIKKKKDVLDMFSADAYQSMATGIPFKMGSRKKRHTTKI